MQLWAAGFQFTPADPFAIAPGYHAPGKTFHVAADGFHIPTVSDRPTPQDVARARTILLDESLG
jgi:hypothetical protein